MTRLRLVLVLGALAVFGAAAGPEAQAAFPGGVGRIAYTRTEGGASEIFFIAPDGTGEKQPTETEFDSCCPAWSPDGSRIAFSSNRSGRFQLHMLDLAVMQTIQLTAGDSDVSSPDWQPLSPIQGDVDCNGAVNSVDALGVLRAVAQMPPPAPCLDAGDVDCSGALTSVDALKILRYVAGMNATQIVCTDIGEPLP